MRPVIGDERPFRAVIFDLDGVLVDAEIWWDEVRIAFAQRHGRTWSEADRAAIMGANSVGWSTLMRDRLDLPAVPREVIEDEVVEAMVERYATEGPRASPAPWRRSGGSRRSCPWPSPHRAIHGSSRRRSMPSGSPTSLRRSSRRTRCRSVSRLRMSIA